MRLFMKAITAALALATISAAPLLAPASLAQSVRPIALQEFLPKSSVRLTVTTPAFPDGGDIPFENTQYRGNSFPGLAWSAGPSGTKSYAVIMQDPDAQRNGEPILHWTIYNLPASVTKLDAGMAPSGNPPGSSYGPNVRGDAQPYMGPRTPPGPKHHYHLQVFALDTTLPADPAMKYDGLTGAMKGHILASGEVVGLAQADPNAPPPAPKP
jgi:para-nitrobenzyl esterase